MAFQAEQKIKSQILKALGTEQIFKLLSDPEVNVLMKTLGLLRNLLSTKPHIDLIMSLHGIQIMQVISDTKPLLCKSLNLFSLRL
jgi:armadillo repeat-containing protein 8